MIETEHSKPQQTLGELLSEIWLGRRYVAAGLFCGFFFAFVFSLFAVQHSRAHMVLAPALPLETRSAGVHQQAYAAEDAFNAKGSAASNFTRFEVSYKGAAVANLLLRDPEITAGLARDTGYIFSRAESEWTPEKLAEYIGRRVGVDPVGETPLRTFTYLHPDKEFAAVFLRRIHAITDGLIRHAVRKEVNERIGYLNAALSQINNPEHRRAMTNLLMEQERLKMLVSIDQPYAAAMVVPASPSSGSVWPDYTLLFTVLSIIGAIAGYVVFSIRLSKANQDVLDVLSEDAEDESPWYWPESDNNNKPLAAERPLTGKKPVVKTPPADTPKHKSSKSGK